MLFIITISTFVCISLVMMGIYWLFARPQSAATERLKRLGQRTAPAGCGATQLAIADPARPGRARAAYFSSLSRKWISMPPWLSSMDSDNGQMYSRKAVEPPGTPVDNGNWLIEQDIAAGLKPWQREPKSATRLRARF